MWDCRVKKDTVIMTGMIKTTKNKEENIRFGIIYLSSTYKAAAAC
jgi:hypothetical protein